MCIALTRHRPGDATVDAPSLCSPQNCKEGQSAVRAVRQSDVCASPSKYSSTADAARASSTATGSAARGPPTRRRSSGRQRQCGTRSTAGSLTSRTAARGRRPDRRRSASRSLARVAAYELSWRGTNQLTQLGRMDAQERRSRCGSRTTGAPMRRLRRRRNRRMPERSTHERTARGRAWCSALCVWDRLRARTRRAVAKPQLTR